MNTELRKRLAKAADKYALGMFDEIASRTGFIHGAEHGYKEAIAQAKEWMRTHLAMCVNTFTLSYFEEAMNKLWEEQK